MAISTPLIAKGLAGLAAIGAPVTLSVVYKDSISNLLSPASTNGVSGNQQEEKEHEKINKKLKELGIPENKCKFSESDKSKECNLAKSDLNKLEFITSDSSSLSTEGESENDSINLKIEIVDKTEEKSIFGDHKFSFPDIKKTIKVGKSESQTTLKKGSKPEFKLNSENKLEKAWTIDSLSKKINLTCTSAENDKKCVLDTGKKINVKESNDKKSEDVSISSGELKFEENQENHNQGFKFTVSADIDLTKSETTDSSTLNPSKLTKENSSYEIVKDGDKWYLSKVASTVA